MLLEEVTFLEKNSHPKSPVIRHPGVYEIFEPINTIIVICNTLECQKGNHSPLLKYYCLVGGFGGFLEVARSPWFHLLIYKLSFDHVHSI